MCGLSPYRPPRLNTERVAAHIEHTTAEANLAEIYCVLGEHRGVPDFFCAQNFFLVKMTGAK